MPLWAFTEDDVIQGLRRRGLPVDSLDDLTAEELELIRQYTDWALDEAARELLDMLAQRFCWDRGLARREEEP